MGETKIEWTDYTWNPWQGCTKVSAGCKHCYMYRNKARYGQDPSVVVRSAPATFNAPLAKLPNGSWKIPSGSKLFVCSWSDFYHEAADAWRDEAWAVIAERKDLTFIIVTKRPERIYVNTPWMRYRLPAWEHVWGIVSVENQDAANERIPTILACDFVVRGVSMEPLIGPVDLLSLNVSPQKHNARSEWWSYVDALLGEVTEYVHGERRVRSCARLDWVIVGGESGTKSQDVRPMHPDWVRAIRDQCVEAEVPFFFKQWGEFREFEGTSTTPGEVTEVLVGSRRAKSFKDAAVNPVFVDSNGRFWTTDRNLPQGVPCRLMERVGKRRAGRLLDGREWNEFPKVIEA